MLNNRSAWKFAHHTDSVEFLDVEIELFLFGQMRCIQIEENIFVFEVIMGLLLFEVLGCTINDL